MNETGPVYDVELIDVLPCNRGSEGGMKQAMPSRLDLQMALKRCPSQRVVAGYEVLLNHWRDAEAEIEWLRIVAVAKAKRYATRKGEVERLQAIIDKLCYLVAEEVISGHVNSRSRLADYHLNVLKVGGVGGPTDVPTWMEQYRVAEAAAREGG